MRDIFIKTLTEMASRDLRIILVTGDLGFGVLQEFERRFPKQFLNVGVAEQNMTSIAAGLALEGHIVFTYSIANFPTLRCLEQIRNDVCYHNLNVNIVSVGGGFSYGALGASHHACEDIPIFRTMPNILPLIPSDNEEVRQATALLVNSPGPGFLRLDKTTPGDVLTKDCKLQIGKMNLFKEGDDFTLFVAGGIMKQVLTAAEILQARNISCRVLSCPSPAHVDSVSIRKAVDETGGIITIEEGSIIGGIGSAVAEFCLENNLSPKSFKRLGAPRKFVDKVGQQNYLVEDIGLDAESIAKSVIDQYHPSHNSPEADNLARK